MLSYLFSYSRRLFCCSASKATDEVTSAEEDNEPFWGEYTTFEDLHNHVFRNLVAEKVKFGRQSRAEAQDEEGEKGLEIGAGDTSSPRGWEQGGSGVGKEDCAPYDPQEGTSAQHLEGQKVGPQDRGCNVGNYPSIRLFGQLFSILQVLEDCQHLSGLDLRFIEMERERARHFAHLWLSRPSPGL